MAAGPDTGRGELASVDDWREQQRRQDLARREEVMRLQVLPVREHGVIGGRDGDVRVCKSVGPAGEVVAVWTTAEGADAVNARTVSAGGASFPDTGTDRPVTARITVHNPGLAAVTEVRELTLAHIMVQPMPGDRFLVAGARCRWHPDGPEPNAVAYDAGGQAASEHVLGDGIGELLATSSGQVWVGYFDEGIYGNYGWGHADTEDPVGMYGIVRFSPALEPDWRLPRYTEIGPWDPISDCPALNVDDTSVWACYDSDYPIVRIRDGKVRGWHNDVKGPAAMAAAGSRVALVGGGRANRDRLAVTGLGAERAELAGEYRLVLPGGEALPQEIEVIGRGSRLHFLTGASWYQLDMDDLPG
jgi:hypothetical protein